ncbi:MAG: AAA family ATPase [Acidobacteria bacterium]|nr:AAA family ATPase [Acidobacteriota bacterium]
MKQFESFALDTANECLWHEGAQIALASKPFSVLRYLVENPGRLISHDELLDALWPETYVQPQVLRTYVLELRKILNDDAKEPRFIQTIPKRGYSFVAAVKDKSPAFSSANEVAPAATPVATELVGRDDEILRLQTIALQAAAGQRQVVFITGEAGIGKTSLVNAFRHASSQTCMAWGHCVEGLSEKEPYYAVLEALSHCFASADHEKPEAGVARLRTSQDRPAELCEALEELSSERLFILVIEDIQWAHQSTLELLAALARRSTPARLLVIATYRPLHHSTKFYLKSIKQDLVVRQLCTELALEPLCRQSTKRLLSRRLHQEDLPVELSDFIYQRSGGNPLFAHALLDHMIAERSIVRRGAETDSRWEQITSISNLEVTVPQELARLIELEIDRLSPEEQRVLEAGSLMNIAFPVWSAAAALGVDQDVVEELCDGLERRTGLVRRAGHDDLPNGTRSDFYAFAHEFYREVLYQRQTTSRRAKGHIRIAEQLSALFAGREATVAREVAQQYEAAGNWYRTIAALRAGALHSRERNAHEDSTQLLTHALRIVENLIEPERTTLADEIAAELQPSRGTVAPSRSQQQKAS